MSTKISYKHLLKSAYDRIEALETERDALRSEPIAIIGMGCRFPGGADSPALFWQLLEHGVDAITEVPVERWDIDAYYDPDPEAVGKMYTRYGGFLFDVEDFDALFFGISPREALSLDPQQRLLLEVSWEALEQANQVPSRLFRTPTGVFVGICANDYQYILEKNVGFDAIDAYVGTGNAFSCAAGRLSYTLGLTGPSLAVDTACSSSLVAVHLAVMSLRHRECDAALAGGVNLIFNPALSINFSKARMMAPDGRCKTFDAAADGYVRGEGCGIVVLKRLSDALAAGDNVLAVIRGSALNQDGPSSGLTVPNGRSQEAVIRSALSNGGISAHEVGYIEAHGTGTELGDPIEVETLGTIFGPRDANVAQPLQIGSVKTNFGHLEGAAGIASLIKVVLMLQHGQIPPHLHFNQPSPYISWDKHAIQVPIQSTAWPAQHGKRRIAGVSSFGFSGTNAHLLLEEGPDRQGSHPSVPLRPPSQRQNARPLHLLTLSAKTEAALRELAVRYNDHLANDPHSDLADICFTANTKREQFKYRLAVVAESKEAMREQLKTRSNDPSLVRAGFSRSVQHKIAFLFTGQGSQYVNMGRDLYETDPIFRQTLEQCDKILRPYLDQSLLSILYPDRTSTNAEPKSKIDKTIYTQPALFALDYALAQVWQSWGVKPDVVMGHSIGELVAACVAGVFSLEDGLRLVAERGRLMQATAPGEMAVVFAHEAVVQAMIQPYRSEVSLAAINTYPAKSGGPQNVVISGKSSSIQHIIEQLTRQHIKTKRLTVSHAFHSPLMKPILPRFLAVARRIRYTKPRITLISNVTGQVATPDQVMSPEYWVDHILQPVRFADGVRTLHQMGTDCWLEIGPKPVLLGMARQIGNALDANTAFLPSLRPPTQSHQASFAGVDWQPMLHSLANLYERGISVAWSSFYQAELSRRRQVQLPTYAFQRERYWPSPDSEKAITNVSTPLSASSQVMSLLHQGDTKQLLQKLQQSDQFSASELELLPKMLSALAKQHQQEQIAHSLEGLQDWFYELEWQVSAQRENTLLSQQVGYFEHAGTWLIFADQSGLGQALAERLAARGEPYLLVYAHQNDSYRQDDRHRWLNPTAPEQVEQLIQEVEGDVRVIHLWSLDPCPSLEERQRRDCGSLLHLVQHVAQRRDASPHATSMIWVVMRGAVSLQEELHVATAPLWGLGKVVALEHPKIWGGMVDLAPLPTEISLTRHQQNEAETILAQIMAPAGEKQLVIRNGQRYVARLVRHHPPTTQPFEWRADGTYLITGGLGALGLKVARWMIKQGARHLVLIGRRGMKGNAQAVRALKETGIQGTQIEVMAADVSREEDLLNVLTQINRSAWPLRGIVHAAGVVDLQPITEMNLERLLSVLRPKVLGGWLLHQLTKEMNLDFFVMFSSMASVWGSKEQAHYTAANQFLDGLAHLRAGLGLPALSINWGPWAGTIAPEAEKRLRRIGVNPLNPAQALQVLGYLLGTNATQITVATVDWSLLKALYEARAPQLFLEQIESKNRSTAQEATIQTEFLQELQGASPKQVQRLLISHLQEEISNVLGFRPEPEMGFFDIGMDSLMAVELKTRLEGGLGIALPSTLAFDYPNIQRLSEHLLTLLLPDQHAWQTEEKEITTQAIEQLSPDELMAQIAAEFEAVHQ